MKTQAMLCILTVLSFVVGCKADKSSDTQVKLVNSSIINGQKGDEYSDKDLTLSIASVPQTYSTCTGVLISSNVVLTAAHCIKEDNKPAFIYLGSRAPYYQYRDIDIENKYFVEKVIIHPSYSRDVYINGGNFDLALIVLKEKAREPFIPMKINDGVDFIQSGVPIHIAGFSWYSVPFKTDIFDRLTSHITEEYKEQNYESDYSTEYLTKNIFINENIKPNDEADVINLAQFGGGLCSGDSGGPAMIKSNDHLFLVGINRAIISPGKLLDCEYIAKATSVSFHKTWLIKAISEAGAEQPEFVSSIALKDLDSIELQCGKMLMHTLNVYATLQDADSKTCSSLDEASIMNSLTSLDEKCQKTCQGIRGFEGQCDFYIKGAEKMKDRFKAKCDVLLDKKS